MSSARRLFRRYRLDLVAGLCDGILSALTLAAGKLLGAEAPLQFDLALRVAVAGAISSAFMLSVAHYSQLRGELAEAEKELNLLDHGRLVTSRLGQAVLIESGTSALFGSVAGFSGALLPLLIGVLVPGAPWLAIAAALAILAVLGASLAIAVSGRPVVWVITLVAAGVCVAYLGSQLKLI